MVAKKKKGIDKMSEEKKIKLLIEKFKGILENTDMDICESVKGRWYFLRYDKEYKIYDKFLEFETAEELIEIIIGELSLDMTLTIEDEADFPEYSYEDLAEIVEFEYDYKESIAILSAKLDKIIQDDRLAGKDITKLLQMQAVIKEY